ncbi:MAG TPA: CDP-alcohol phosphatidyltransferase family protein [Alphaproteobacteria bacterium]
MADLKPGARGVPYDQRLGALLVQTLARTPIAPNHLTGLSFALGALAGWTLAQGRFGLGAGLFMLAVFIDHLDGELARATRRTSRFGHYLDYAVGAANYTMMYLGAGIGLAAGELGSAALTLGLAAALSNPAVLAVRLANETRHGSEAVAHPYFHGFEIEDFIYLIGPFAWLGWFDVFFLAYALGALGYLAWQTWELVRRVRATAP